jgi:FeS assembly SUF system protein
MPNQITPLEDPSSDKGAGSTPSGHRVEASSALASGVSQKPKVDETPDLQTFLSDHELEEKIVEAIKSVYDPEIPVNVYDLGLIYGVVINPDRTVNISMTLTTPNCPAAGFLPGQVEMRVRHVPGVEDALVDITFDPPYSPDMMSDEAKLELGFL